MDLITIIPKKNPLLILLAMHFSDEQVNFVDLGLRRWPNQTVGVTVTTYAEGQRERKYRCSHGLLDAGVDSYRFEVDETAASLTYVLEYDSVFTLPQGFEPPTPLQDLRVRFRMRAFPSWEAFASEVISTMEKLVRLSANENIQVFVTDPGNKRF